MLDYLFGLFSHDLGIDLGTANILVHVGGKGIVVREPSIIARDKRTKKLLGLGSEAKKMIGKAPEAIEVVRPLRDGVIADFDATETMLKTYIRQTHQSFGLMPKIPRPRVAIGIPSGVTEVERKAVHDAVLSAGARSVFLIEEPMAAAIGADLPVEKAEGQLVVDIGGGTTEIAVISLGGIVIQKSLRTAGDEMDEAIVSFARLKYGMVVGLATAERVKISIGSAIPFAKAKQYVVRGRDMETGLPRSQKFNSGEIREALGPVIQEIVGATTETIEETPPELVADILEHGIVMAGGISQIYGIDKIVSEATKMPVWVTDDPMTAVVRGCAKVLENERLLKRVKVAGNLR